MTTTKRDEAKPSYCPLCANLPERHAKCSGCKERERNQALAELVKEAQEMGEYDVPQPEVLARRIVIDAFIETIGDGDELTKFKLIINAKLEAKHG